MMNRIAETIRKKSGHILNVYFTAGHPDKDSIVEIIRSLQKSGADLVELGMPYSDPLADGLTIQKSSAVALNNGIVLDDIFEAVRLSRMDTSISIILMGYLNQLLQYGVERFLSRAQECGVSGLIVPDLPMDVYEEKYLALFEKYGIGISFLITPQTSEKRIRQADRLSSAFIYMVSQTSITGKTGDVNDEQLQYFQRISAMNLLSPRLIGFGIHDHTTFSMACKHSDGAIVGSAFIRALEKSTYLSRTIEDFVKKIRS